MISLGFPLSAHPGRPPLWQAIGASGRFARRFLCGLIFPSTEYIVDTKGCSNRSIVVTFDVQDMLTSCCLALESYQETFTCEHVIMTALDDCGHKKIKQVPLSRATVVAVLGTIVKRGQGKLSTKRTA